MENNIILSLKNVTKQYPGAPGPAIEKISFDIRKLTI